MSSQEIKRLEVVQKLLDREIKQNKAAEVLGISTRQVQRLIKAYRSYGVTGLISKKRDKPSNNRIANTVKEYAMSLVKSYYTDFGPTLATEKLREKHDIKISV